MRRPADDPGAGDRVRGHGPHLRRVQRARLPVGGHVHPRHRLLPAVAAPARRALPHLVVRVGGVCHPPRVHVGVPRATRHDLAVPPPGRHRHQRDAPAGRRDADLARVRPAAVHFWRFRWRWPGRGSPSTAWAACWWPASRPRCCCPASPSGPASSSGAPASACRATPPRCWLAHSSCGGCITWTIPCCGALAPLCSTACSPMCSSCSPSGWDCCSWCSARNASDWRRVRPSWNS